MESGGLDMTDLHPQVRELLASLSVKPPPQPWDISMSAYRSAGEKLIGLAGEPNLKCDVKEINILLVGRTLKARSYYPKGSTAIMPCVVYFHGGGFIRGSLDTHDRLCRELSVQGSLCVVSVAYRLAPENPYPAARDDAIDSFSWVSGHCDELRIDPDALAVAGDSSGGNLAAVVASRLRTRAGGPPVRAQGLLCPVLDLTLSSDSVNRYRSAPLLSRAALEWCIDQYVPDTSLRALPELSPLLESDLDGAPPAVIVNAEVDPVADDAGRYYSRLRNTDTKAYWREYPGMPHSFLLLAGVVDEGERAISEFTEAMSRLLT